MSAQEIFEQFCIAHPHEMYAYDPERFWRYFHHKCPNVSRAKMVELVSSDKREGRLEV